MQAGEITARRRMTLDERFKGCIAGLAFASVDSTEPSQREGESCGPALP